MADSDLSRVQKRRRMDSPQYGDHSWLDREFEPLPKIVDVNVRMAEESLGLLWSAQLNILKYGSWIAGASSTEAGVFID